MYYYAFIDSNGIATGTYGFPSVIDLPNYIYLGQADDRSVIGKRWNASRQTFEEVVYSTDEVVSIKGQKWLTLFLKLIRQRLPLLVLEQH